MASPKINKLTLEKSKRGPSLRPNSTVTVLRQNGSRLENVLIYWAEIWSTLLRAPKIIENCRFQVGFLYRRVCLRSIFSFEVINFRSRIKFFTFLTRSLVILTLSIRVSLPQSSLYIYTPSLLRKTGELFSLRAEGRRVILPYLPFVFPSDVWTVRIVFARARCKVWSNYLFCDQSLMKRLNLKCTSHST